MSIENYTGNVSPSSESAHDKDSTLSSVINIDNVMIKDIITDQAEWKGQCSTASQPSRRTENISIDESDGNDTQGYRYFKKPQRYLHQAKNSSNNTTRKWRWSHEWRYR